MVHADRRDHGSQRRIDDVGGVKPAAETDLQQHHIGRMPGEQTECRRGLDFKNGDRRARIGPLAMFERRNQFLVIDENATAGAAKAKTFVEPHQIG